MQTRIPELGPVVFDDLAEGLHKLVKGVRLDLRSVVRAAIKQTKEILEGFPAAALFMNHMGGLEPQQLAFFVVIGSTPVIQPASSIAAGELRRDRRGGIEDGPPGSAGAAGSQRRRVGGQRLPVVARRPESAARSPQVSEIRGVSFVNPQKVRLHRSLKI